MYIKLTKCIYILLICIAFLSLRYSTVPDYTTLIMSHCLSLNIGLK